MDTSATNKTPNYGLPIFIGTDKPSWLVDWNNSMTEIDTILKNIDSKGVATQSEVDALTISMTSAQDAISEIGDNLNTLTSTVGGHTTSIDLLGTDVANIKDDLIAQNKLIKTLSDTVIGVQETVNSVKSDLDELKSDVITVGSGLSAVDGRVDGLGRDVTSLRSELTTVDGKVDGLETNVITVTGGLTRVDDRVSMLENRQKTAIEMYGINDTNITVSYPINNTKYALYEILVNTAFSSRYTTPIVLYFDGETTSEHGIITNIFSLGTTPTFESYTVTVQKKGTGYIEILVSAPINIVNISMSVSGCDKLM